MFVIGWSLTLLRSKALPRFDGIEQVFDSNDACERFVGNLDAQLALKGPDDLQHAQ